jgi:aspartyl-tRNA(Asn)/glutamyl-tRNA(Gln) amidotransferase subunit A
MAEFAFLTIPELGRMLRQKETTATELATYFLDRLERLGPEYNAVVAVTRDRALAEASAADELGRRGRWRGPLHGIPYGAKDLLAAQGYPTTWGAEPLREQVIDTDATVIARLKEAGAVLVAKLAMVELAGGMGYRQADASFTGPGRTPWNPDYWSGGSSSGSGAAVAAGLVPFAIGSETWGSIVTPAAFCGVSGLRPTYDVVSRYGAMALSWTMDKIGPICRTAEDCAEVLEAIATGGPPGRDGPQTFRARDAVPPRGRRFRIGVLAGSLEKVMEETRDSFDQALAVLGDIADVVRDVAVPDYPYNAIAGTIVDAEGAAAFDELVNVGAVGKLTAPEDRFGGYDGAVVLARDYLRAMRLRRPASTALDGMLRPFDALVSPTLATVAWPLDKNFRDAWPGYGGGANIGGAANMAGLPGIAVMNGLGRENLPTSMVFTGRAYDDARVLAVAREYQKHTDWHLRRAPVEG